MSGGDGRGPGNSGLGHNGGQASGNVNGTSGKGGPSSGGGTDPNSGPGWGTTHTPNGDIHNYNPGEFGNGGVNPVVMAVTAAIIAELWWRTVFSHRDGLRSASPCHSGG